MQHPVRQWMLLLILKLQREQLCAGAFELHCYHFHDDSWLNFKLTSLIELLFHSRILSTVWTLSGPLSSQQSLSSMEYTAVSSSSWVLWSISASLNHKELDFGPSSMSPEVRHIWKICHAPKNKTLDPSSLPWSIFTELQRSSDRKHNVSVRGGMLEPQTQTSLQPTAVVTAPHFPWPPSLQSWLLYCCPLSHLCEPGQFKQTNLNSRCRFILLIFTEVGLGALAHVVEWEDQSSDSP